MGRVATSTGDIVTGRYYGQLVFLSRFLLDAMGRLLKYLDALRANHHAGGYHVAVRLAGEYFSPASSAPTGWTGFQGANLVSGSFGHGLYLLISLLISVPYFLFGAD